jgi:hypothetical protein
MREMKEEVILRILVQESLKSELRLKRYGENCFRDLFEISRKCLGLYLRIQNVLEGFYEKKYWDIIGILVELRGGNVKQWLKPGFESIQGLD